MAERNNDTTGAQAATRATRRPGRPPASPEGSTADGGPSAAESDIFDGRYRILERLGEGGMAEVFLCEDLLLRRKVAVKKLMTGADQAELELFRKETAAAHSITHPNVARTYDIGAASGRHYISMEWLHGETLMRRVRRAPLAAAEVRALAVPLCRGLHAAHRAGIVHRDLKPANVMLVRDSRKVVVMDFGIAGLVGSIPDAQPENSGPAGASPAIDAGTGNDPSAWSVTSAGRGTPAYMAPEQWRQESGDARTDIYALGVILYVALTCKSPFPARTIDELRELHYSAPPPDVSEVAEGVDRDLAGLIQRCMAKRPEDRPSTMAEVIDALDMPRRRRKWLVGTAIATAVTALLAVALYAGIFTVAKGAVLKEVRPGVERLARLAALELDPAALRTFRKPADMAAAAFKRHLVIVKRYAAESPEIKAVYVLQKTDREGFFAFRLDNDPLDRDDNGDGEISEDEEGSPPGSIYDGTDFPAMAASIRTGKATSDPAFGRDQWGVTLSGYAPVRRADGTVTDMFVGIDVGNEQLDALAHGLELVLGVVLALFVAAYGWATWPARGGGSRWTRLLARRARTRDVSDEPL